MSPKGNHVLGEKDPAVPVHFSRDLTVAITRAGGSAKYTEHPGVDQDSWSNAYEETSLWQRLFLRRKSADAGQHRESGTRERVVAAIIEACIVNARGPTTLEPPGFLGGPLLDLDHWQCKEQ